MVLSNNILLRLAPATPIFSRISFGSKAGILGRFAHLFVAITGISKEAASSTAIGKPSQSEVCK